MQETEQRSRKMSMKSGKNYVRVIDNWKGLADCVGKAANNKQN